MRARTKAGTRTYIIDRLFRDQDNVKWIVDFKTSHHEGADIEAFLDRERERYAPQLQAYLAVVDSTYGGLYFPLLNGWRQIGR